MWDLYIYNYLENKQILNIYNNQLYYKTVVMASQLCES